MPEEGHPQGHEQLRATKVEIKNVLPFDLYETMMIAGYIATDLRRNEVPPERHVKDFYARFYALFSFTEARVSDDLANTIDEWFKIINVSGDRPEMLAAGAALFHLFYNEMSELGVGQMFDEPIEPPIAWGIEQALMLGIAEIEAEFNRPKQEAPRATVRV